MTSATEDGERKASGKARDAFRTISEVAEELDLPQHVLRFWESKFTQVKPLKRGGNRRYYRPDDIVLLKAIRHLLHAEGYTIRGVQKLFKEQGLKATIAHALGDPFDDIGSAPPANNPPLIKDTLDTNGGAGDNVPALKGELELLLNELKVIRSILS